MTTKDPARDDLAIFAEIACMMIDEGIDTERLSDEECERIMEDFRLIRKYCSDD